MRQNHRQGEIGKHEKRNPADYLPVGSLRGDMQKIQIAMRKQQNSQTYQAENGSNRAHDFQCSQQEVARSRLVFNRVLVARVRTRNAGNDLGEYGKPSNGHRKPGNGYRQASETTRHQYRSIDPFSSLDEQDPQYPYRAKPVTNRPGLFDGDTQTAQHYKKQIPDAPRGIASDLGSYVDQ